MAMDDGSVTLWDTLQGKSYHNFTQIHNAAAMDLVFSPFNDLVLASVGLDKHLMVFDVKRHKYVHIYNFCGCFFFKPCFYETVLALSLKVECIAFQCKL